MVAQAAVPASNCAWLNKGGCMQRDSCTLLCWSIWKHRVSDVVVSEKASTLGAICSPASIPANCPAPTRLACLHEAGDHAALQCSRQRAAAGATWSRSLPQSRRPRKARSNADAPSFGPSSALCHRCCAGGLLRSASLHSQCSGVTKLAGWASEALHCLHHTSCCMTGQTGTQ